MFQTLKFEERFAGALMIGLAVIASAVMGEGLIALGAIFFAAAAFCHTYWRRYRAQQRK